VAFGLPVYFWEAAFTVSFGGESSGVSPVPLSACSSEGQISLELGSWGVSACRERGDFDEELPRL